MNFASLTTIENTSYELDLALEALGLGIVLNQPGLLKTSSNS